MCQYACLPAPKQVMVWILPRRDISREEAKAVRNAVVSQALMKPKGWPIGVIRVSAPCVWVPDDLGSWSGRSRSVTTT